MKNDLKEILLDEAVIRSRIQELGKEIDDFFEEKEILLITLLDGAIVFTADLIRNLSIPLRLDCLRVSSYGDSTDPETAPRILSSLKSDVRDREILLVDDILDTGNTMQKVHDEVMARQPASVHSCVFLDKPDRRENDFKADWVGFSIPDEFVVGYGIDFAQRNRNLPFIGKVRFT